MDNTSLRNRLSLSTTNLSGPIAESTCLNGFSSRSKFNWGEGSLGSRNRNDSPAANRNDSLSRNRNGTPSKVAMSPSSRIDPRTYVDIHSNGLASRIVKYHDNSARLNRSLSMGNLYNKPGQFPVVHLKKIEQPYKAKKTRNLSMTRIAAPEKSIFHGNTLSSILRSGSIVGLQKSDEEISRENRPILHPPPTENEMAPTRSVLEVLKEISRKRINSDEIDGTELIKKHCKESEQDVVSYNGQRTQSKRQRETNTSSTTSAQISPEQQVIKKRMCNYNNDIMSSLSSSMLSVNKKKMFELQNQKRSSSDLGMTNNNLDNEYSRNEKQRCMANFDLERLTQAPKYTPISPLPNTPQEININGPEIEIHKNKSGVVSRCVSEPVRTSAKPKLTLFNKNYDEVPSKECDDLAEHREEGDLCGIQFVKPKKSSSISSGGSLLMEKTKKSKLALMLSGLKGELNDDDEVDAPVKEQLQKQTETVVSLVSTSNNNLPITSNTFAVTTTTVTALTPIVSSSTTSAGTIVTPSTEVKTVDTANKEAIIPVSKSAVDGPESNTTQLVASTTSTIEVSAIPTGTTTSSISGINSSTAQKPAIGGFSFGLNKPQSSTSTSTTALTLTTSLPQTTTSISTAAPAPTQPTLAGIKPFSFGLATAQAPTSTPSFSFGAPSTIQSTDAPKEQSAVTSFGDIKTSTIKTAETTSAPIFGQTSTQPTFSFGSLSSSNSSASTNAITTTSAVAPSTTNAPTLNFGTQNNTWNPAASQLQPNAKPLLSLGTFGGTTTNSAPQSNALTTATPTASGFSFSNTTSSEAPKPAFGSVMAATTTSSNSTPMFSFSANKPPATQASSTTAFTFGSPAATSAASTNTAAAPMFGNITPVKPSNTFTFGAQAPTAAPQKPGFSFASSEKPVAPTPTIGNPIGGFSFNNPPTNAISAPDASKNIFGTATAAAAAPAKPAFSFGSATNNQVANKTPVFGGASNSSSTNLFGAASSSSAQNTPFTFGSNSTAINPPAPSNNLFGAAATSNQTSNGLASSSNSIFGSSAPTAAAPIQQTSSFSFGGTSNITQPETNKPGGAFVFGSSSSIGSNAAKPTADLNKTFVFGDGNTTISPAPPGATSLFGGSNSTSNTGTENKTFTFGAPAPTNNVNNMFTATREAPNKSVNQTFNFSAPSSTINTVPAPNGNMFPPPGENRPIRKAMRRLNKP